MLLCVLSRLEDIYYFYTEIMELIYIKCNNGIHNGILIAIAFLYA